MVYPGAYQHLPLEGELPMYLRSHGAKLDHRPPLAGNNWNSAAPEKRSEEEMQVAAAKLKLVGIHPLPPQRRKKVVDNAKKEAVVRCSPLLGSGMPITWSNFDFMHAIANLGLLLLCAILGYGMAKKKTGVEFLKYIKKRSSSGFLT